MKQRLHQLNKAEIAFLLALLCALSLQAGPQHPKVKPKSVSATAPAAEPEIPKSVFIIPATAREGRNPFFPHSTLGREVPKRNSTAVNLSSLVLNGITSPPHKLVMINGRTFEEGEKGEVRLPSGATIEVTCIEIKSASAIIKVGPQLRELRLQHGT
jgi:hypothetical protein